MIRIFAIYMRLQPLVRSIKIKITINVFLASLRIQQAQAAHADRQAARYLNGGHRSDYAQAIHSYRPNS